MKEGECLQLLWILITLLDGKGIKHSCHSSKQCPLETDSHYHHSHLVSSVQKEALNHTGAIIILSSFSLYIVLLLLA